MERARGDRVAGRDGRAAPSAALLLTCLWYIREVDPQTLLLTGLTRDGVYLVEDGEVVGAVNNFRFNESPVDLLGRVTEVGAHRADPAARVGRLLHPRGDAAAAGRRTSTCPRSARPARPGPGLAPCGRRRLPCETPESNRPPGPEAVLTCADHLRTPVYAYGRP